MKGEHKTITEFIDDFVDAHDVGGGQALLISDEECKTFGEVFLRIFVGWWTGRNVMRGNRVVIVDEEIDESLSDEKRNVAMKDYIN